MVDYDVIIAGGGIAGSVAAKFAAKAGLKTLLIEKYKTPRSKPCSGIQFGYFEKILGEKIPQERLCNTKLTRVKLYLPNGFHMTTPFPILNFMRKPFDAWLNQLAKQAGAEFRDETEILSAEENDNVVVATIKAKDQDPIQLSARYLLDATGLRPKLRMQMRPQDFEKTSSGATLNYYINGTADMNPHFLYQFWNIEWNDCMFAWVYVKSLDDGKDYWVVGTGGLTGKVTDRQTKFYNYIKEKFHMNGEIVHKEGYSTTINMEGKERVWLGQGRILMVGDAAGLVDMVRGVGMDAAALSGRLVVKAIQQAEQKKTPVMEEYAKCMQKVVAQTKRNQTRQITGYQTNEELLQYMKNSMLPMGLGLVFHNFANKFRSPENQTLMPP